MFEQKNIDLLNRTLANHGYQMVQDDCDDSRVSAEVVGSDWWVEVREVGLRDEMRYQLMSPGVDEIYTTFDGLYTEMMRLILDSR